MNKNIISASKNILKKRLKKRESGEK